MGIKKSFVLFGIIVFLVLVLIGCGSKNKEAASETESKPENDTAYTVEHAMGTTEIPATPKRVVILTNEGTEALLSMGVKPVGAVQSWSPTGEWYDHIEDQMEGVEIVGTESDPNLEAIAALEPDLIIGNKMRQEKFYDQFSQIAPTVFSETLRGDWKINFELYAKALNKEEEGKKVMAEFDQRIEDLKAKLGDKVNTEISLVRFMPGTVRIYYNDTFAGVIFKQIGLKRPPAQDKEEFAAEVTKERIPEMEGDILFYWTYETGDGEGTKIAEEWTKDPLWNNLEVVKAGKAYEVVDAVWNTAGGVIAANKLLDELESYLLEKE